jgi:phospholipid/cholesterol/gamma-HCH transport system permease protein
LADIVISIIKSISFGMIIAVVAISHGLAVERATTEVPVAGLKAVGTAFGSCIVLDVILAALFYIVTLG